MPVGQRREYDMLVGQGEERFLWHIQGRAASFFWFVEITIVNCGWQKKVSPLSFWGGGDLGSKEFWELLFQAVSGEFSGYLGGYFRCWKGDWDYDIFAFHAIPTYIDLEGSAY